MSLTVRAYVLDRFRADALALHRRADALDAAAGRSDAPIAGPDAATSRRMALACDDVAAMIEALPESTDAVSGLRAVSALLPLLGHRAEQERDHPAVRAVYVGAATRIGEVRAAEEGQT